MTADDYVRMVSFELRDLPWRMRHDLVAELREHLAELPQGTNLSAQLGAPESTQPSYARRQASSAAAG